MVVVGRDTRRSGRCSRTRCAPASRPRCAARRRAADARRGLARARAGCEPRSRHLGLAQPVPRQRHQALRSRRLQARRRTRIVEALMGDEGAPRRGGVGESARWPARPSATPPGRQAAAARRSRCPPLRVLVDCAHGAASTVAPLVFAHLGIEHVITAAEPDGVNINDRVGSTHLDALASGVRAGGFDLGLAFDGDADRMLAVDADGTSSTATRSSRCSPATCRSPGAWRATRSSSRRCRISASTARCASSASRPS